MQKLGIEKVPPIVTTAVLLDAKAYLGKGTAMEPGALVTAKDIEAMLKAQGLHNRGLLPGDVLYIYTGWGDNWKDPDTEKFYYTKGPGLAYDAAKYIEEKQVVLVALDNPFTDPVPDGMLQGKARPAAGTPPSIAVRDPSPQSGAGRHPSNPERQPRRARQRQGLAVLHDDPAAARSGRLRFAGAPGSDRGAGAIVGREPSIDGRYRVLTGPQWHLQPVQMLIRSMSCFGSKAAVV